MLVEKLHDEQLVGPAYINPAMLHPSQEVGSVAKVPHQGVPGVTLIKHCRTEPGYRLLKTVVGIGDALATVILLETGEITRFADVGNYASYCRCVGSKHESNGKKKGEGNTKNGNRYLAWAFVEAANFAVRYCEPARRFYQKKKAKRNSTVAVKAVAHKLARACYHILKNQEAFCVERCFA